MPFPDVYSVTSVTVEELLNQKKLDVRIIAPVTLSLLTKKNKSSTKESGINLGELAQRLQYERNLFLRLAETLDPVFEKNLKVNCDSTSTVVIQLDQLVNKPGKKLKDLGKALLKYASKELSNDQHLQLWSPIRKRLSTGKSILPCF